MTHMLHSKVYWGSKMHGASTALALIAGHSQQLRVALDPSSHQERDVYSCCCCCCLTCCKYPSDVCGLT